MELRNVGQDRSSLTQVILPETTHRVVKRSGSAHMKSIWNAAAFLARSLMIGCKPNASSTVARRNEASRLI